jgi:hypothetical protein
VVWSRIAETAGLPAEPSESRKPNRLATVAVVVGLALVIVGVALWATRSTSSSTGAVNAAVVRSFTSSGSLHPSDIAVTSKLSSASTNWAVFKVGPTSSAPSNLGLSPVYGFAHLVDGTWVIVDYGSSAVGCPTGTSGTAGGSVPTSIESAAGYTCPTVTGPTGTDTASTVEQHEQQSLAQGLNVPPSEFTVVAKLAPSDKAWAWWRATPSASLAQSKGLGSVYGFDHYVNGVWTNVDNGSAMVGCGSSGGQPPVTVPQSVPTAVLAAFGYHC